MSKGKYCPDYHKLYPNTELTSDVLDVLKKSDRKMKYAEYDLKAESFVVGHETETAYFVPSREDSLERLMEIETQFRDELATPEQILMEIVDKQELRRCLALLNEDEQALIHAIFYDRLTELTYSKIIGMSQTTVSWRKRKILAKLRALIKI